MFIQTKIKFTNISTVSVALLIFVLVFIIIYTYLRISWGEIASHKIRIKKLNASKRKKTHQLFNSKGKMLFLLLWWWHSRLTFVIIFLRSVYFHAVIFIFTALNLHFYSLALAHLIHHSTPFFPLFIHRSPLDIFSNKFLIFIDDSNIIKHQTRIGFS